MAQALALMIGISFLGHVCIFAGLSVINGYVLPETLAPFYARTSFLVRTLCTLPFFFFPANLLISHSYRIAPQLAHATLAQLLFTMLGAIMLPLLIEGVRPNMQAVIAFAVMIGCGIFFVKALYA